MKGLNIRYRKTINVHAVGNLSNPYYMIYVSKAEVITHYSSRHSY